MAASLNKVTLIGNLARDPEIRKFDNGGKVANMRVITNETWTDKDGNRQERTEGHSIAVFNERLVEVVEKYLKKGNKVYLEGMLRTRKYQDKDGNDRYTTEIELPRFNATLIMLGGEGGGDRGGGGDDAYDNRSGGGDRGGNRGGGGGGNRGGGYSDDRGGNRGGGGGYSNDRGGNRGGGFADDLDDDVPF